MGGTSFLGQLSQVFVSDQNVVNAFPAQRFDRFCQGLVGDRVQKAVHVVSTVRSSQGDMTFDIGRGESLRNFVVLVAPPTSVEGISAFEIEGDHCNSFESEQQFHHDQRLVQSLRERDEFVLPKNSCHLLDDPFPPRLGLGGFCTMTRAVWCFHYIRIVWYCFHGPGMPSFT